MAMTQSSTAKTHEIYVHLWATELDANSPTSREHQREGNAKALRMGRPALPREGMHPSDGGELKSY